MIKSEIRQSGDFELTLATGELATGNQRYRQSFKAASPKSRQLPRLSLFLAGKVHLVTPALIAIAVAVFLGVAGGLLTDIGPWYRGLRKPRLNPPDWLFGPAWTVILGLAAWAAVVAWNAASSPDQQLRVILLFGVNAVLHFLWSPLFFKLRRPDFALVEVAFLWASLIALVIGLLPISRFASLLVSPYLLWVSFAMWLNWQIVRLNPRAARQD